MQLIPLEIVTLPSKATNVADWKNALPEQIALMGADPSSFAHVISQFHSMRQNCRDIPPSSLAVEILVNYYRQLDMVSRKIAHSDGDLDLEFLWHDAFDRSVAIKQRSIAFEKANILFNIASSLSQSARGLEVARDFQAAASVLEFIAENFLHAPLMDISRPSLKVFQSLMLAQAQEAVVCKAAADGKSDLLLSKLAASTASFYKDVCRRLASVDAADLRCSLSEKYTSGDHDIYSLIRAKSGIWDVLTEYYHAVALYNDTKMGPAIARLRQVNKLISLVLDEFKYSKESNCCRLLNSMHDEIPDMIEKWEKENILVYTQLIPEYSSLPTIPATALVKTSPLEESWKFIAKQEFLFKDLLSIQDHEAISKYSEEKSKLLRFETMKVTTCDNEFQTILTSFGFPSALDDLSSIIHSSIDQIPEEFQALRNQAMTMASGRDVSETPKIAFDRFCQSLDSCVQQLEMEMDEHQKLRLEMKSDCTQQSSHELNAELFKSIAALQKKLGNMEQRVQSTESIISEPNRRLFDALIGSAREFVLKIPSINETHDQYSEISAKFERIKSALQEFDDLSQNRNVTLSKLKTLIMEDNDQVVCSKGNDDSFQEELSKFSNVCNTLDQSISDHNRVMTQFRSNWEELKGDGLISDIVAQRKELLHKFEAALNQMTIYLSSSASILAEISAISGDIQNLEGRVSKFCSTRTAERSKIYSEKNQHQAMKQHEYLLSKLQSLATSDGSGAVSSTATNVSEPPHLQSNYSQNQQHTDSNFKHDPNGPSLLD